MLPGLTVLAMDFPHPGRGPSFFEDSLKPLAAGLIDEVLYHRTAYRQSAAFGGTVHHLGRKAAPALHEIEALTDEVLAILET